MGEGASRQDHSSLASLSLFHTSETLWLHCGYSSNWIGRGCRQAGRIILPLPVSPSFTPRRCLNILQTASICWYTQPWDNKKTKYRKTQIQKDWKRDKKREAKRKKNWTYSTTDSCCCCTRDWTDRRANELASRWHTVHPVVMGQGSGIRTKTLLEDWRWFALNLPWIILRPCMSHCLQVFSLRKVQDLF